MPIDVFSTQVLNKTVEYLDRPASFLLDVFFGSVQTADTEEIFFDIDKSKPRLAPFVSPLVAGKVVADQGYETKSFKPAYVKDKRQFKPDAPLKRTIGEMIGGTLSPQQRRDAALKRSLANQLENLTRREEVMASEALRLGQVTVTGDNYPTVVVGFQRDAALTITLTGVNRWGQAGIKPLDLIEDWSSSVQTKSGAAARTVIMDPLAWRLFKADSDVSKLLTVYRGTNNTLSIDPMNRGQANDKARYVGTIGDFDFWVYQDNYVDDNGVTQQMLPNYTVIVGSTTQVEGVRCYGVIQDEKAGYRAQRYFSKSWLEEDPALRWLLLQSAPLVVPYRPNATLCATVN
jgi:hypothetical protein